MTATNDDAASRRSRLLGIKLRALVREHLDDDTVPEPDTFAPGAALVHHGEAWVLLDDRPESRLGAAVAWALRTDASALHVVAESATGLLARRATAFSYPITVWHAEGRSLWPAVAEPLAPPAPAPDHHRALADAIAAGGAEPMEEHGVVAGEVGGLEVCRDVPTTESLARIVQAVAEHRRADARPHPLNRLARERLLRAQVIADPSIVGAESLRAYPPPVPRTNLKDPVPCVAAGVDPSGRPVVVVCSSGVDLDLVPYAADARAAHDGADPGVDGDGSRLVIVTPSRDRLPVVDAIAARLRVPATFVALD